jgi:hypothetical protein
MIQNMKNATLILSIVLAAACSTLSRSENQSTPAETNVVESNQKVSDSSSYEIVETGDHELCMHDARTCENYSCEQQLACFDTKECR